MSFLQRLLLKLLDYKDLTQWFFLKLLRDFDWARFVHKEDYSWSFSTSYKFLEKKLLEIQTQVNDPESNYYHQVGENWIKAIRVSLKLLKRINTNFYYDRCHERHHLKWGFLEMSLESVPGKPYGSLRFKYSKAESEEHSKIGTEEYYQNVMEASTKFVKRDRELLFKIINKYQDYWEL